MLNLLKVAAIKTTDWINRMHDPFDNFTRPIIRRTSETLWDKEQRFSAQLKSEFLLPTGIFTYWKSYPGETLDLGDQALWHGIYTAMWAFKYQVTQDAADLLTLRESVSSITNLFANGKLIRGRNPDTGIIADDPSNDTLTGVWAGLYFSWKHGNQDVKSQAALIAVEIASSLLRNNHCLLKQDGTPTTYGVLIDGWKTDPLRLTLCMAVYAVAYRMTMEVRYANAIQELWTKYRELMGFPKVKFLWWEKKYDTHRAALHLAIIRECVLNPDMLARCEWGLTRIWEMERKAADPWLASICGPTVVKPEEMKRMASRLHEYEFDERGRQTETLNTLAVSYWKSQGVRFVVWDGKWRASQPLPFWKMGSQDFFPQRDLFSADNWPGQTDRRVRYNGGDFLASYWRMRLIGAVSPDE